MYRESFAFLSGLFHAPVSPLCTTVNRATWKREPDLFFWQKKRKEKIYPARAHTFEQNGVTSRTHVSWNLPFSVWGFFFCRYNSCHWQCRHWRRRFPSLKKSFQITHGACFFSSLDAPVISGKMLNGLVDGNSVFIPFLPWIGTWLTCGRRTASREKRLLIDSCTVI